MIRFVDLGAGGVVLGAFTHPPKHAYALRTVVIVAGPEDLGAGEAGVTEPQPSAFFTTAMVDGAGMLVARPMGPVPVASAGQIVVPACPAGTRIEVFDMVGRERLALEISVPEGWSDTYSFPDAGRYRVEVEPPAPWLPSAVEIEVAP